MILNVFNMVQFLHRQVFSGCGDRIGETFLTVSRAVGSSEEKWVRVPTRDGFPDSRRRLESYTIQVVFVLLTVRRPGLMSLVHYTFFLKLKCLLLRSNVNFQIELKFFPRRII